MTEEEKLGQEYLERAFDKFINFIWRKIRR